MYEKLNDQSGLSYAMHYIGDIYFSQSDLSDKISTKLDYIHKALSEYFRSLKIAEKIHDEKSVVNSFNCIGNCYRELKNYDLAFNYYNNAVDLRIREGDKMGLAQTYGNIGKLYLKQENYARALEFLFLSLKLSEETDYRRTQVKALGTIGNIYLKLKDYEKALDFCNRSLALSSEIGFLEYIAKANYSLSHIYSAMDYGHRNGDKAFNYYKSYIADRDSINTRNANQAELKFEFDKREQLARAEQGKKDAIARQEQQEQRVITTAISIGLALVLVLAIFILRSYKKEKRAKALITEQKKEVEKQRQIISDKNKDITDSITYARRIQQAKLPAKEEIASHLKDCFVLFKPKDIVSGDFYYFTSRNGSVFIAAADCTGHGVPGAIMSMVGSEKLEDAVNNSSGISEILQQLNKGIKSSLRQSDNANSTRDGMDIALCEILQSEKLLCYAGANRPLWIVRKGASMVEEIKATKSAIGGLTHDDQTFESHKVAFNPGDTLYICTDGYADQFNGNTGKKLMTKKFREILLQIQSLGMQEQMEHLDHFIEEWKAGTEQVDDILVIGIRL
jgi:serine phosphatase RsbU (regulator of sigma subunit)